MEERSLMVDEVLSAGARLWRPSPNGWFPFIHA